MLESIGSIESVVAVVVFNGKLFSSVSFPFPVSLLPVYMCYIFLKILRSSEVSVSLPPRSLNLLSEQRFLRFTSSELVEVFYTLYVISATRPRANGGPCERAHSIRSTVARAHFVLITLYVYIYIYI